MKFKLTTLLLVTFVTTFAQKWQPAGEKMKTRWAAEITPENVWQEYPRPQFERSDWMNLNGLWNYSILKKNLAQPKKYQGEILVPFCVESSLSGVMGEVKPDDRIWYKRTFEIPTDWSKKNVILNFEAVDYSTTVFVNGAVVGAHKGAYDRFSFDITEYLTGKGEQELVVCVDDPSSFGSQPRGKQQMPQEGIWYTPVSGIWQTVWMETVSPEAFLKEAKLVPDIDEKTIAVTPVLNKSLKPEYKVEAVVSFQGKEVAKTEIPANITGLIDIPNPELWSTDAPNLYNLSLKLFNKAGEKIDEVQSYFGMRKISLGNHKGTKYLFLNNQPVFQYGPLDQGWWPDGLHTPPSDEAMKYDIEMTKKMGFNMIRKHIKVEPDRWFYHCDKLGMLVWQDMPSGMVVIPKTGNERPEHVQHVRPNGPDLNVRNEDAQQFELELRRMIDIHYNSPSIVMWVPFNEGWGQYTTCRIAKMVKDYDPTRLVNAVSGWALRNCGDVYDIHTYQTEVRIPPASLDRASVIGEYGGIGYPIETNLWNPEMRNWGYQTYHSEKELLDAYIYKFNQIVEMKKTKGLSAAVYTQTTDVEGEVNGLITYDREVIKIPVDKLNELHSVLYQE
ncbi:glycoside hydrolase family 2 [Maribellus comscasis]|uniref:Glycoside hydrolase family 2 n=1 Tax=Maribellus comscasis TaxID=2681766 RepID=A0A6I6K9K1_9BACT|nr:sugar-binding domain-containing protein [Maribellus comscasis]QGY46774.1 glycoside hydrolase family 2 [Maribellus comscasis]